MIKGTAEKKTLQSGAGNVTTVEKFGTIEDERRAGVWMKRRKNIEASGEGPSAANSGEA